MAVGWIKETLTWANDQPLAEDFRFWSDRTKTVEVEIADAVAYLNQKGGTGYVEMTVANDRIVIADNIVGLRVEATDMENLTAGTEGSPVIYELEVKATDTNGGVRQIRGLVNLIAGLAE